MYRFIESIYWKDGFMPLIDWHEQRFAGTQIAHFGTIEFPSLRTLIDINLPEDLRSGAVYKIRMVYAIDDIQIEFQPYKRKYIRQLQLVQNDTISYPFKYENRIALHNISAKLPADTEGIIVRNNELTDTGFTNIALFDGKDWYTPIHPLLEGVHCASLLSKGILHTRKIGMEDLSQYSHIRLVNAMVPWEESWEFRTSAILPL